MEHLLAKHQEINEFVRRNTHQAQVRQKQKIDRHLKAKAHAVGDAVWVFCHIIPKGGTRKLLRAWRGPDKVTDVLQDWVRPERGHHRRLIRHSNEEIASHILGDSFLPEHFARGIV